MQVPIPALKEQIATVTGVLSDQQRLICRGKVLRDDELLSAYRILFHCYVSMNLKFVIYFKSFMQKYLLCLKQFNFDFILIET